MIRLAYNAERIEMDGRVARYIDANGQVTRVETIGKPRKYICTACGGKCEYCGYTEPLMELCHFHKTLQQWKEIDFE